MHEKGWKSPLIECSAFIAVAAIAFVGGLLIGDLGASPKTETVVATSPSAEGEETEAPEAETESGAGATAGNTQTDVGAQVFAATGCGSCHTFKAANSTGTVGPDLNEFLAPDDDKTGIEEMIVDPNAEIAEGFSAGVMPQDYRARAKLVRAEGTAATVDGVRDRRWFTPPFRDSPEAERIIDELAAVPPEGYAACCDGLAAGGVALGWHRGELVDDPLRLGRVAERRREPALARAVDGRGRALRPDEFLRGEGLAVVLRHHAGREAFGDLGVRVDDDLFDPGLVVVGGEVFVQVGADRSS